MESQHNALIDQYLAGQEIGKPRKARPIELDMAAQIAGTLAGQRAKLNVGLATGGQKEYRLGSGWP